MSTHEDRVPLLLRLAVRFLPADIREEVLGDLLELWRAEVRHRAWAQRVVWLFRQPLATAISRLRFGGSGRRGIGLASVRRLGAGFSWVDVKLGVRLMLKHPIVTLVVVFALALAIPASLAPHHLIDSFMDEAPPFQEGDRVVGLMARDGESGRRQRLRLGDYELLLERLTSFQTIGAALPREVNVISGEGQAAGERGALMTASSFALARVPPMMGRTLSPTDEDAGAPDVVVVGYGFWRSRLGGAPDVVGTTIRIAGVPTTIVGVMPEGFGMPSSERLWLPLRLRSLDYEDGLGPGLWVYGRLSPGVSLGEAESELSVVGARPAVGEERGPIRTEAVAYSALEVWEPRGPMWVLLSAAHVLPLVFLLIACGNVGILLLARTATRTGEVAIRTALGASRSRIVGQLFIEALVLALVATGIGLLAADMILKRVETNLTLPFWLTLGATPELVLKALLLAVFSAVIAGVLPALRATGTAMHRSLQRAGAGGGTLRLGRLVGTLIVVEVGLGVGALFAGVMAWHVFRATPDDNTRAADADRYLVAEISVPRSEIGPTAAVWGPEEYRIRVASTQEELAHRLASEPRVRRWTFSDEPPGEERDERSVRVDGDGYPADFRGLPGVATFIDPDFFAVLGVSPIHGRAFDAGDVPLEAAASPAAVIVNMKFLERRGMTPNSIGRRIRFTYGVDQPPGPWMEIVGVVPNIEASKDRVFFDGTPVVYLPATPGALNPMTLLIELDTKPTSFAPRLRSLLAETNPTAILDDVHALDDIPNQTITFMRTVVGVMGGLSFIAILLSTAALYALMSLTVAQRTREIGIRTALGGNAERIGRMVARRALMQLSLGVALGSAFWVAVLAATVGGGSGGELEQAFAVWPYVLFATAGTVVGVGLAACVAPTLKAIRIRPVEALRADG